MDKPYGVRKDNTYLANLIEKALDSEQQSPIGKMIGVRGFAEGRRQHAGIVREYPRKNAMQ
jgi:hypothetical protein